MFDVGIKLQLFDSVKYSSTEKKEVEQVKEITYFKYNFITNK